MARRIERVVLHHCAGFQHVPPEHVLELGSCAGAVCAGGDEDGDRASTDSLQLI
jgi:hypothetical protein